MTGNEQIRGWPDYSSSMYDDDPFERDTALNEIWAQVIPEEMWANPTTPEKLEVEVASHALSEQDHVKQSTILKNVTNGRKRGRVHRCRPKISVGHKEGKAGDCGIVTKQLQDWIKEFHGPYVGQEDKQFVADRIGIDIGRVTTFCSNYRKRYALYGCNTMSYQQSKKTSD
jgi:hypothetical protein